jgi:hypothetical protein
MTAHKVISDEKLVEYLDSEVSQRLLANGIYDINNYGWVSEDTVDPEFKGHAIWQTNPPFETEWEYLFGNDPIRHRPTEKEELLIVAGNDFEGLMQAGRLSIGLALLHESVAEKYPLRDNHYFWLHNADAILQLNMASDRIREYFIVTFFDKTSKKYNKRGKENGLYVTPFNQVRDLCNEMSVEQLLKDAVIELPDIAAKIFSYRETRNIMVHEIATKLGETNRQLIRNQRQAYDDGNWPAQKRVVPSYDELKGHQSQIESKHKDELAGAVTLLKDWYNSLVKFSSFVFEAEYWLRKTPVLNRIGGGFSPPPSTPPGMRVRTRRFPKSDGP